VPEATVTVPRVPPVPVSSGPAVLLPLSVTFTVPLYMGLAARLPPMRYMVPATVRPPVTESAPFTNFKLPDTELALENVTPDALLMMRLGMLLMIPEGTV